MLLFSVDKTPHKWTGKFFSLPPNVAHALDHVPSCQLWTVELGRVGGGYVTRHSVAINNDQMEHELATGVYFPWPRSARHYRRH